MHHERYGLHLYRRWRVQSCILEVLKNAQVEMILGLKLLKRANRVGHIAAMDVYTVLRTNAIHLKAKPRKKEKKALRSVEFFSWASNLYKSRQKSLSGGFSERRPFPDEDASAS